jgi:hypothetical protein
MLRLLRALRGESLADLFEPAEQGAVSALPKQADFFETRFFEPLE